MLVHKFIKPGIFQTTETIMSWKGDKVQEFYKVRFNGTWFNVHDDRLETAIAVTKGLKPKYVTEMTQGQLDWFNKYHLPHSENSEESVQW